MVRRDENIDSASEAITLTQVTSFGSNPGNLLMYKFVPAGLPTGKPLVAQQPRSGIAISSFASSFIWS